MGFSYWNTLRSHSKCENLFEMAHSERERVYGFTFGMTHLKSVQIDFWNDSLCKLTFEMSHFERKRMYELTSRITHFENYF